MKDCEVLKKHKKCLMEDDFLCIERNCYSCDYLTEDDDLIEALDNAIQLMEAHDGKC